MAGTGAGTERSSGTLDTFPKLLKRNAHEHPERFALREKEFGIWQSWTWRNLEDEVRELACGLAVLGLERGDRLAIIGDNRPRLYAAMCAAQSLGAIPVPMYQDSGAKELRYVMQHAEARFAIAEDQEQVDKLLELRDSCPGLEKIVYVDPRGMRQYDLPALVSYAEVQNQGRELHGRDRAFWDVEVAKGGGADACIILYTSGTTGIPKGVVLLFDNVVKTAEQGAAFEGLGRDDEVLAYLPMAWVGDHIFSFAQSYVVGFCASCPESSATVLEDLREIGPTYFFAPPRIYENLLTTLTIRMEDASRAKRAMFHYFMEVARRAGIPRLERRPLPLRDRILYALGELLVYGPLKNTLGFSRIRVAYTAGEAIGPDIFDFYRALGVNMKQLYGQTESTVFVTVHPDGEIRSDTVGTPAPGVELKVNDDGEVLYRSPGVFHEYYKNPEATARTKTPDGWVHTGDAGFVDESGHLKIIDRAKDVYRSPGVFHEYYKNPEATARTKTPDGWVHTGDAGFVDESGHLKIIDRAKDVGKLSDGTLFAPKYIENKLKFFPQIKEAVAFGDGRDRVAALVNIDLEAMGNWAERHNVAYASYQELASHPQVLDIVQGCVARVNADLASDAQLAGSQVTRFISLHKELDADDGELTRTRKIRRGFVAERYRELVDALYAGQSTCRTRTEVTFEDGRTGSIEAELEIRDVAPVAAMAKAS